VAGKAGPFSPCDDKSVNHICAGMA
jgi:hypothetical protein